MNYLHYLVSSVITHKKSRKYETQIVIKINKLYTPAAMSKKQVAHQVGDHTGGTAGDT